MAFCRTARQFYLLGHLYADGIDLSRFACLKFWNLFQNGKLDIGGAGKWHYFGIPFTPHANLSSCERTLTKSLHCAAAAV